MLCEKTFLFIIALADPIINTNIKTAENTKANIFFGFILSPPYNIKAVDIASKNTLKSDTKTPL
jgi:hypothetical protein